ncbi:MAG: FtsW/RodA/SpoVE family cell cycle protein [Lachnospiraceae bacterium]|nr:FtsW/RodA/SpoVE family cell cycle protein [Lachnospiraceae bacterium]
MTLEKTDKSALGYKIRHLDFLLILPVLVLSVIGIIAVSSADSSGVRRQIAGVIGCTALMLLVAFIDYQFILKFWWLGYVFNLVLLVLVMLIGHESHGASRWLYVGGISVQPSELAKILLILFYAKLIMKYGERLKSYVLLPLCALLLLPPLFLVYKQPDLSTTIMFCIIFAIIMYTSGVDRRIVAAAVLLVLILAVVLVYTAAAFEVGSHPFLDDYQQRRILAWLHPEDYATSDALQTLNSLMAIGSGQLFGKGINTNEITSVLSGGYISESDTDLIFTVIGEEMGFLGAAFVVLLVLMISVKCLMIAGRARDQASRIIASSVAAWIGFQAFMNMGVATGVMPNTGIPLPFVSSGLSALISVFIAIGVVLNIGMQGKRRYSA